MLCPCSAPWWKDSVSCSLLLEVRRKKFVFFILAFQRSQVYLPAPQIWLKLASASGFLTWGIVMPGGGHGGETLEPMSQQVSPGSCHGTFQKTFQSALQQPGLLGRGHWEIEEKLWLLQWWCAFGESCRVPSNSKPGINSCLVLGPDFLEGFPSAPLYQ